MSVIIIYPGELFKENQSELKGTVQFNNNCVYFYVLNQFSPPKTGDIYSIGFCNKTDHVISNETSMKNRTKRKKILTHNETPPNWIELTITDQLIHLSRLIVKAEEYNVKSVDVTFVQYSRRSFFQSKLLNYNVEDKAKMEDCFQLLQRYVDNSYKDHQQENSPEKISQQSIAVIVQSLQKILNVCRLMQFLTISSLYNQFASVIESTLWFCQSIQTKKNKLKLINYASCIVLDVLVGVYLLHCFHKLIHTQEELFSLVSNKCESIVGTLHQLVVWLQGNPAGLKLNHPLTYLLGKFSIYHIQLWWSFLVVARPVLEFAYSMFLIIGYCGFTYQLCIISDLLTFASFHVYCIYVYAARLYNIQLKSLLILTRVFIGKKRNPEPGKVDSVPYTTEQLFIGTIAFTILLFLLPTTLVYYVVFTSIRLAIICVEGCLNRIKTCFQTLPIFVTLLYLLKSPQTTSTVKLTPQLDAVMTRGRVHILATPVHQSLLHTVRMTVPDPLNSSNPVLWRQLLTHVLTGKLV